MQRTVVDARYTLVEPLGGGGMAQVYLAHDEVLDRDVALKILRKQYAHDEEFVERFRREAQNAAALSHPNVVSVYDRGRSEDGTYYIAMEYVPGGTLKDRIVNEGPLDPGSAAELGSQVAGALGFAHERGVIHRDVKPQNILLSASGEVKVADFGIARAATATTTSSSLILGTAGYMSPEQAMGEPVGPQSDLYSLGVVLYEMLTGKLPYEADSPMDVALQRVNEPPRSPRETNPNVPEALDALTVKLLAKNPEDRYASADELIDDLERARSGLPPAAVGAEKTTAPLPAGADAEAHTAETVVEPPPAPAPVGAPGGRGGRRRAKPFLALATVLFAVLFAALALAQYFSTPASESPEDTSGTEETTASKVRVPQLYYAAEAESMLADAGLKLGQRNDVPNDTVPAGVVIQQDPAAGTDVEEGTTVDIVVSTGPQQVLTTQAVPTPAVPVYDEKAAKKAEEEAKKAKKKAEEETKKAKKK
jgi:serine/threonine-protein kinase